MAYITLASELLMKSIHLPAHVNRVAGGGLLSSTAGEAATATVPTKAAGRAHLELQNAQVLEQLRRANEELSHFVRALSHDMNVNLMLLENSFGQLRKSLGNVAREDVTASVSHVEACLRQSRRFLDDLVELGRTGSVPVEPSRVEVAAVVEEVLFEQRDLLAQRGVKVKIVVEPPLPAAWCHADRLKQVVANLVRNAVKHGCDRESPRLTIAPCAAPQDAPAAAAFRIHDNGPGIAPQFREEIFLPGRRLANAHPEGSGMGLAIVKKIVDHYGGGVCVDPACRVGTAFVVWLPKPPAIVGESHQERHVHLPKLPKKPPRRAH
jgi:signal transduction histidine kinase